MDETFWKNRKVLITGASGFVGKHLLEALGKLGADIGITEMNNIPIPRMYFSMKRYRCNLADYDAVNRAISRFQPEIVFHLAAQPIVDIALHAPFDTMETNVRGTYNLLEACRQVGKDIRSFVYMSTDKVYGETTNKYGSNEISRLDGVAHPYNASKLAADILVQSYASHSDFPVSIIRSGNIYGPNDTHWERLIPYVCRCLVKGEIIHLRSNGKMVRDYIYIDDVIDALLLVGQDRYSLSVAPIYNLGSDNSYSVKEVVDILVRASEESSSFIYEDTAQLEIAYQHMDYTKIKFVLGWFPKVDMADGLNRTYHWYAENLR